MEVRNGHGWGRFIVLIGFLLASRSDAQQSREASMITVERLQGRLHYRIDSQEIKDLLKTFNSIRRQHGAEHPVYVMMDREVPIHEIWNVSGTAAKAQLTNLRFFAVFRETEMMSEIKPLPAIRLGTPLD